MSLALVTWWMAIPAGVGDWYEGDHVRIRLEPPLASADYRIAAILDDAAPCQFTWRRNGVLNPGDCQSIAATSQWEGPTLVGLIFHGAPRKIELKVRRGTKLLIDATLHPVYEQRCPTCPRYASEHARCIPGTENCEPFQTSCDGPEDCAPDACCASTSQAYGFGSGAATYCQPAYNCPERTDMFIACHSDADCPDAHSLCDLAHPDARFRPPLLACRSRTGK